MSASPAPDQRRYRIGVDDGTWSGHAWKEAAITAARHDVGYRSRIRIQVDQPNGANWTPSLRLHIRQGGGANAWASLPVTSGSTASSFWIENTRYETQGSVITSTACGSQAETFVNGNPGFKDTINPGGAQANINAGYTEIEWSVRCLSSTRTGSTYSFRMTDNGTVFTTYTRLAVVVTRATTLPAGVVSQPMLGNYNYSLGRTGAGNLPAGAG